ncbi:MAG TPA: carboxypeptidase-like regulatory domain-containing protein [Prolixibacteraceae bacterium]|nr:carboxypeptidase-like regulatory domain-containing protein [Prolixibacteraceae bacterium]HPT31152.1 carboxypeptidase-like regulatory domain-containing protein [Prolixibacteraceae bacterium]
MKKIFTLIALFLVTFAYAGNEIKSGKKAETNQTAVASEMTLVTLTGQVTDNNTGEPLTGVKISLQGTDTKVYTDFDGRFRLENLKPGNYQLSASLVSYSNSNFELSTSKDKNTDLSLKLQTAD